MSQWNPWHGCRKISPGCRHCYVFRMDAAHGRDASQVRRTGDFDAPLRKRRNGEYRLPAGETVYTCFTSDFFLPEADGWRPEAWRMIRLRQDADFFIVTKRADRIAPLLPPDWGEGYPNVILCCTCEDQARADFRLPFFLSLPLRYRRIICEPLLERIDLAPYLASGIDGVIVGGESGPEARLCDYAWVLDIRRQCAEAGVAFSFKQTGARFLKDGRLYRLPRALQHPQAKRAGIDLP